MGREDLDTRLWENFCNIINSTYNIGAIRLRKFFLI